MIRKMLFILVILTITITSVALAQLTPVNLVTQDMLQNPSPNDWLMYSRTYDAQRFSPLNQITKQNVGQLKQVWSKDMLTATQESIPLVHDGVMYVIYPLQGVGNSRRTQAQPLLCRSKVSSDVIG